ncbi:MAG: putative hydrolase [Gemmatimonadetes bacterium]|nr:putative hydrolase [Gemmatimonadota bacterium]
MTVRARGLDFAVWTSPPVPGTPPLLLVNGGLIHDHALLWPALSPLAAGRQVILYDQRGRGASSPPPDPAAARIEDDAGDVGALRRALGIRQWDVLGHSWGGGIAMLGVAGDQAGTRRLVTVDAVGPTSAWMAPLHDTALERLSGDDRATLQRLGGAGLHDPDPGVHGAHNRAMYRAWFADADLAEYLAAPLASSVTGAAVAARLRREGYDWRPTLRALSTPTLVLHGERDALSPSVALELTDLLPRAYAVLLPDAGHMPFWEAPQRFFELVGEWLASASPGPPRSRLP